MGIGTPQSLGGGGDGWYGFAGGNRRTPVTWSGAASIQTADLVVVGFVNSNYGSGAGHVSVSSINDGVNNYSQANGISGNAVVGGVQTYVDAEIWYCANCAAVGSPSFTINVGTNTAPAVSNVGCAFRVSRGKHVSPLDVVNQTISLADYTSTAGNLAVATGGQNLPIELVVGCFSMSGSFSGNWGSAAPFTEGAGFGDVVNLTGGAPDNVTNNFLNLGFFITSNSGSVTYNPSWGSGADGGNPCSLVATFKPQSAGNVNVQILGCRRYPPTKRGRIIRPKRKLWRP